MSVPSKPDKVSSDSASNAGSSVSVRNWRLRRDTYHTLWLWASQTYASLTHQLQVDWSSVNTFDAFSEENKAPLLLPQFILQVSTAKLLGSACSRWWRCSPPLPPCSMLSGMCGVSFEARNIASQHWITGGRGDAQICLYFALVV